MTGTDHPEPEARCAIAIAESPDAVATVGVLLREYQVSLGLDLEFQGFSRELAGLPGDYGPPHVALLIATLDRVPVGCVGLRRWDESRAEMKRLFVRPAARGHGVGRALATGAIAAAGRLGYREILLDTLPTMTGAQALYCDLGFVDTAPYRHSPVTGTRFLVRTVQPLA